MGSGRLIVKSEEVVPEFDEGWWSSILADEGLFQSSSRDMVSRNNGALEPENTDWKRIQELHDRDEITTLNVYGFNRGGVLVRGNGIQGFVPVSHLIAMPCGVEDAERNQILTSYVGRPIRLKVIECEPSQERVVFSERAALAGEGQRKEIFRSIKTGHVVEGQVTNITEFGVFIDLGGVEGLVHLSELSWGRVQSPSDTVKIGQTIQAVVLQISEESSRVALSVKRLQPNPWDAVQQTHKAGDILPATITSIMRFGVFARLEEGIEGLIHISSIEPTSGRKDLTKMFFPGQDVRVKILHIDSERRRLGLSLVMDE